MSNLKDLEPELRDEVKSKIAPDMTGTVIAKYPSSPGYIHPKGKIGTVNLLDIRLANDKIYYGTPVCLWEVVKLNDE